MKNILDGHSSYIWCIVFSPCGKFFSSGSEDKSIIIWNLKEKIKILKEHKD